MAKVFFTYVWGASGNPAWPLTFASKAARTHARNSLAEGDLVFAVGTRGEPTPLEHYGRVLSVFQVSDLEVNTRDYLLHREGVADDIVARFPYALHPLAVWEITSPDNMFSRLVGPLTPTHHLQAQSKVVELDAIAAQALLALERREVPPLLPQTDLGKGRLARKNSKLAPAHRGSFSGAFGDHEVWYVYTLVLRDLRRKVLAIKVGYSSNPKSREEAHNSPLAHEVTGLSWEVDMAQPTASEDVARKVEQAVLSRFAKYKLPSNGEILSGVEYLTVAAEIGKQMRNH